MKRNKGVAGNSMEEARLEAQRAVQLVNELVWLENLMATNWDDTVLLVDIRLRAPTEENAEWFGVVRAHTEAGKVVGFTSAPSLVDLVHLVASRLINKSMKWMEDKPYGK